MELVLKELELPSISELKLKTIALKNEVCQLLELNPFTANISQLIKWIDSFETIMGWQYKFINPPVETMESFPIPIIFDDQIIDGYIINLENSKYLANAFKRKEEMLRYHYSRNIVT